MQAGTRFTYPGGMEGWVDLVDLIAPQPGVEHVTFRSRVQRSTNATTKTTLSTTLSNALTATQADVKRRRITDASVRITGRAIITIPHLRYLYVGQQWFALTWTPILTFRYLVLILL